MTAMDFLQNDIFLIEKNVALLSIISFVWKHLNILPDIIAIVCSRFEHCDVIVEQVIWFKLRGGLVQNDIDV